MFDIGFWEILVIAVVLLLVMGPERLPEVAKQAAFLIRKARQGMFRLRSEMQSEMDTTPFGDIQKARDEVNNLKNDIKQFGRDLADSAEVKEAKDSKVEMQEIESESKVDIKQEDVSKGDE
jgi:sec-independent protein translocase protein TatB